MGSSHRRGAGWEGSRRDESRVKGAQGERGSRERWGAELGGQREDESR